MRPMVAARDASRRRMNHAPTIPIPSSPEAALLLVLLAMSLPAPASQQWRSKTDSEEVRCPTFSSSFGAGGTLRSMAGQRCQCEASPDGLDFSCQDADVGDLSDVVTASRFAIKSLRVSPLANNVTCLCDRLFANGSTAELHITSSKLTSVDEEAFRAPAVRLHTLSIRDSPALAEVPRAVGKVSTLRRLYLENDAIAEIHPYTFFGDSRLSYISLSGNQLSLLAENTFLGLEDSLRELDIRENFFHSFPMSAVKILRKLQSLNMAGNSVQNITAETFTRLESLKFLDLSRNAFSTLRTDTFMSLPSIRHLSLAANILRIVEAGSLDSLHELEVLDLSENGLQELPPDIFARTTRLVKINLSHNRISRMHRVFVDLYALEEVLLNDNLLLSLTSSLFSNTPNLQNVRLDGNVIFEMSDDALHPLKRLSRLSLSHNFLSTVNEALFRYNVALISLSLDNNHLSELHPSAFQGTPKLKELRLQQNILRIIDREIFSGLTELTELHLQDNRLAEIEPQAFSKLDNLQYLDLTGNKLAKLEDVMMRYPSSLRTLRLDHNRLISFHQETFSGQTTTEVLSLSDNRLEHIPASAFVELINLFRLDLSHNRLAEIEDNALIGLHQLRYLDLSNNRLSILTPLTLRGLQQVENVDLSNNRITMVESEAFTGFHHLKRLDLSDNRLRVVKSGAFRGCLTLDTLFLRNSGVRTIQANAMADFKALTHLDLRDNEIAVPEIFLRLQGPLGNLRTLRLSGNNLSNISRVAPVPKGTKERLSLASMPELDTLEMESCNLTVINATLIANNKELKVVKLGDNKLTQLEPGFFRKQVFLRELHLDRNRFSRVPSEALRYLFNLATLNLSNNALGTVELSDSSFDNVVGLHTLDLSNNGLRGLSERIFHNVTSLLSLKIDHNPLSAFPTGTFVPLKELKAFSAEFNNLPFIPVAVQGLRKAEELRLSGNPFQRLKEKPESRAVMMTIREVTITNTNLTTIDSKDFDLFPFLLRLDLSGNRLSRLAPYAFRSMKDLETLDLSRNDILHISRERLFGLLSLRSLNLSRNHLGSLDAFPADLAKMAVLDVSHNRLRSVSRESLRQLTSLVRLDLRGNQLSVLYPEVMSSLSSLRALDLGQNQFSELPLQELVTVEDSLESVNFEGNPLVCSCASHPQKTWLRQHRKWLSVDRRGSKVGPRCREPEGLAGRHLLTVKDSELCPLPSVVSLDYASRDPYDFLVTWESPDTNMTGLKGFIVAYHRLDRNDQVRKYRVGPTIRGFRIHAATDNALYLVCVVTRGSSFGPSSEEDGDMVYDDGDTNRRNKYDKGDFEEEEDYSEDDNEFYVMPLEWTREERSAEEPDYELETVIGASDDGEDEDSGGFDFNSLLGPFGMGNDQFTNIINGTAFDFDEFPSSNDTDLLVVRPTVVNLGSRSSKCIQIRTPPDPAKLSLIDNKRISVVIGVGMGLLVFVCIIISIVAVKSDGDDEEPVVMDNEGGENSLSSSHKSPKMSSNTAPAPIIRPSRANSISSSMAAKLLESEGNSATAVERIKKHEKEKESKKAESLAGTLKRKAMSRQKSAEAATDRGGRSKKGNTGNHRGQQWSHLRRRAEGSTTDSRRSSSESTTTCTRHSRHNSFDGGINGDYVNVGRAGGGHSYRTHNGNGGQSWHGTPRVDPLGRRSMYEVSGGTFGSSRGFLEQHQYSSTTFPRRHTAAFVEMQQQQLLQHQPLHHRLLGTSRSLDAAEALKRRSDPSLQHQDENASLPLIEYHLVDATNDPPSIAGRGHFPPALTASNNVPLSGFYPSTARGWNGARPKALSNTPPVLRSTAFGISDSSNHAPPLPPPNRPPPPAPPPPAPTVGNHISASSTLSAALNGSGVDRLLQHDPSAVTTSAANPSVDDLELEGIDYFPDDAPLTGRTTTTAGGTLPTSRVGNNGGAGGGRSFIKYNSFANY